MSEVKANAVAMEPPRRDVPLASALGLNVEEVQAGSLSFEVLSNGFLVTWRGGKIISHDELAAALATADCGRWNAVG